MPYLYSIRFAFRRLLDWSFTTWKQIGFRSCCPESARCNSWAKGKLPPATLSSSRVPVGARYVTTVKDLSPPIFRPSKTVVLCNHRGHLYRRHISPSQNLCFVTSIRFDCTIQSRTAVHCSLTTSTWQVPHHFKRKPDSQGQNAIWFHTCENLLWTCLARYSPHVRVVTAPKFQASKIPCSAGPP